MTTTRPVTVPKDLGIFIRDMLECGDAFELIDWGDDGAQPHLDANGHEVVDRVTEVDATAPNKLIVYCESGAAFTVRISRSV